MRDLVRTIAVVLGTGAAVFGMGLLAPESVPDALPPVLSTWATSGLVDVQEDSPAWDCHTMGHRVCGSGN